MAARSKKIMVFVIAYNAEKTIQKVLERIPKSFWKKAAEVLLIDDESPRPDRTYEVALAYKKKHNLSKLTVKRNEKNQGYGGNQKVGYMYALKKGYDVVAMLHGDGQYPPEFLEELVKPLEEDSADMVFGSRIRGNPLEGGMPFWKFAGNRFLTFAENLLLGLNLSEYHSGFRAYSCNALRQLPFKLASDRFVFDTDIIIQFRHKGLKIEEITIPTHYDDKSHVIKFGPAVNVGFGILKSALAYRFQRPRPKKFDFR